MLKKLLCLLSALMLLTLCLPALSEEDTDTSLDANLLDWEELRAWAEECLDLARKSELLNDPTDEVYHTEDGYAFVYSFATLYLDTPEMTEDSTLQAIVLYTTEIAGPRGVMVDAYTQDVLTAYYTENETLAGSERAAVLYLRDDMPEGILWGWVQRDGQRIQAIEYAACESLETGGEGYADAGITYLITENMVTAIRVWGLNARQDADALLDRCAEMEAIQQEQSYTQVPTSLTGTDLIPFSAEDLTFSGITFPETDMNGSISALGEMQGESWMQDDDDTYIHVLSFDGCELTYRCDANRENARLQMITLDGSTVEGPRGIRLGDSLSSVLNRFRRGENTYDDETATELLYGDLNGESWGWAEYGSDGITQLRYACTLADGTMVQLLCVFTRTELTEVMLYAEE